ncbi:MAG: ATP-binding cassette domain-containing protein [Candidatus Moranbacteria bacterium]|nr:ATP-binding cassette domain-containing protein [Candidatus Moranbacteria bacterium]
MSNSKNFISFKNVFARLGGKMILKDINWRLKENENWAVLGPNGAGKSTLVRSLWGGADIVFGSITYHFAKKNKKIPVFQKNKIGYVSFELSKNLIKKNFYKNLQKDYSGRLGQIVTAKSIVFSAVAKGKIKERVKLFNELVEFFKIKSLLDKDFYALSSGEIKKILILRALMKKPRLLILDEPFDNLDQSSKKEFSGLLNALIGEKKIPLILVTHNKEEILTKINKILFLKDGKIFAKGGRKKILSSKLLKKFYNKDQNFKSISDKQGNSKILKFYQNPQKVPDEYVKLKNINVIYGGKMILKNLDFSFKKGQNWLLTGPNGAGKSTLVKLITSSHLQSYSNEIWIFGKKRGKGQSIWEARAYLSWVSSELQLNYNKDIKVFEVIASGFFDSVGIYRTLSKDKENKVKAWIDFLKINKLQQKNFNLLSNGQKRIVLIARALVKSPLLLILDEPLNGLDPLNKQKVLKIIEKIIQFTFTNVLFIAHQVKGAPKGITNVMKLEQGKARIK